MFSSSALPAASWGHQAAGIPKSLMKTIENDALICTGIGEGRCHFSALIVYFGEFSTPYARILKELCEAWFRILKGTLVQEVISYLELNDAWSKAKAAIISPNRLWLHKVKGIMSNLIYTLASLSWKPVSIDFWIDDQQNLWKLNLLDSPKQIITQLIPSYNMQQAKLASKHINGTGMERNVDWKVTLALIHSLKGKDDYAFRCALEAIISGSTWPNARIHEVNTSHSELCPRCGVVDSDLHTFWLCPANANIDHSAITSTNKLAQTACVESEAFPCLWLRGICPKHYTDIDEEFLPPP